jgi:hypothetical protein
MLKENANLTWAQDLGADTELLSGDFYIPFGRSTSHQLWSSAMVITPTLRGLFGISVDAQTKTITVNPHLPAGWSHIPVEVKRISVPGGSLSVTFVIESYGMRAMLRSEGVSDWKIKTDVSGSHVDKIDKRELLIPIGAVQIVPIADADPPIPNFGSRTHLWRVIREEWHAKSVTLLIEGEGGQTAEFSIRHPLTPLKLDVSDGLSNHAYEGQPGASLLSVGIGDPTDASAGSSLRVNFPPGEGWKTMTVTLSW